MAIAQPTYCRTGKLHVCRTSTRALGGASAGCMHRAGDETTATPPTCDKSRTSLATTLPISDYGELSRVVADFEESAQFTGSWVLKRVGDGVFTGMWYDECAGGHLADSAM